VDREVVIARDFFAIGLNAGPACEQSMNSEPGAETDHLSEQRI